MQPYCSNGMPMQDNQSLSCWRSYPYHLPSASWISLFAGLSDISFAFCQGRLLCNAQRIGDRKLIRETDRVPVLMWKSSLTPVFQALVWANEIWVALGKINTSRCFGTFPSVLAMHDDSDHEVWAGFIVLKLYACRHRTALPRTVMEFEVLIPKAILCVSSNPSWYEPNSSGIARR